MKFEIAYDIVTAITFLSYIFLSYIGYAYSRLIMVFLLLWMLLGINVFERKNKDYYKTVPKQIRYMDTVSIICLIAYSLFDKFIITNDTVSTVLFIVLIVVEMILIIPQRLYFYRHYSPKTTS